MKSIHLNITKILFPYFFTANSELFRFSITKSCVEWAITVVFSVQLNCNRNRVFWVAPLFMGVRVAQRSTRQVHLLVMHLVNICGQYSASNGAMMTYFTVGSIQKGFTCYGIIACIWIPHFLSWICIVTHFYFIHILTVRQNITPLWIQMKV